MFRTTFIAIFLWVLMINSSFADVKYVQKSDIYPYMEINQQENIPPDVQLMLLDAAPGSQLTTVNYIKGTKKRTDFEEIGVSTITSCDQNKVVELNHNTRTYSITSLGDWVNFKQGYCKLSPDQPERKKAAKGQLYVKYTTKEAHKTQVVNGFNANKYIRETFISGNQDCQPDIDIIENIWVADLGIDSFQCPVLNSFSNCSLPLDPAPCFQDALILRSGVQELPGTIVKTQSRIYYPGQVMVEFDDPTVDYATDDEDQEVASIFYGCEEADTTWDTAGQLVFTTKLINISEDPLPDEIFEIPSNYTRTATILFAD